jgi:protein-S-isoprenylcysteine O-methyltransferase Ste14
MAANWFILLWAVVALLALRLAIVPREEGELLKTFGEEYRGYRARTGALVPLPPKR